MNGRFVIIYNPQSIFDKLFLNIAYYVDSYSWEVKNIFVNVPKHNSEYEEQVD